jgi:alkylation response protein AidB-like acyl-CoA dehydrogenase
MNFAWTVEQDALYARVRRVAREELGAAPAECGCDPPFAAETWRKAAESGLAGLCISPEHGGGGFDCLTTARGLEALGNGYPDAGFGFALAAHLLACCVPIDRHGTEAQKATYLPRLCSGAWIGANAITECESGSDAFALQTRAVKNADGYVLTGEKRFVTNAPVAEVFVVYASTNPGHGLFNISAFLVDRDTPGLSIGAPIRKGGLTTAQMAAVRLDACQLSACQRLGAEGAGAAIFHESIGWERNCLFALWVGAMERQLTEVIQQATRRRQFGRPIGTNQAISHRIVDMKLRLESARLLLYRACWERAQDRASDLSTSLAKLAVSEAFLQSSLDAVQIFGGSGILRETGIERYVRDALPGTIYSGTSEMQRELIARSLGLPAHRRS